MKDLFAVFVANEKVEEFWECLRLDCLTEKVVKEQPGDFHTRFTFRLEDLTEEDQDMLDFFEKGCQ